MDYHLTEEYKNFKVGDLLQFGEGEWSDYGEFCHSFAIKDFNISLVCEDYLVECRFVREDNKWAYTTNLPDYMIRKGYIEEVECRTLFLGSYGEFNFRGLVGKSSHLEVIPPSVYKIESEDDDCNDTCDEMG